MKKLIILFIICASGLMCQTTSAQISFRVNIGSQPMWGPVGYDHVDYYYLPDVEAYYYVPTHKYIYMENGRWINRSYLPGRYRDYNMYNCRKIVINEPRPYMRDNEYRDRYQRSNDRYEQHSIRDSREGRYFENRDHPEHSQWKEYKRNNGRHQGEDNGRHQGEDNGRGRGNHGDENHGGEGD